MRVCEQCGTSIEHRIPTARFCSYRCRKRSWLRRRVVDEDARQARAIARLREPVPVGPFVEWAEHRAAVLRARYADEESTRDDGFSHLMDDIGWPQDSGARRLYRWRNLEDFSGYAERAVIEDALWRAGVGFWEIYPDIDDDETEAA